MFKFNHFNYFILSGDCNLVIPACPALGRDRGRQAGIWLLEFQGII